MDEINFRKLSRNDIPFIKSMLSELWEIDRFTTDVKEADAIISSILYSDLARQDYSEVACINDHPLGILLAKIGDKSNKHFLWQHKFTMYSKTLSSLNSHAVEEYRKMCNSFQRLSTHIVDGSELIFFMISAEARGKGIGNALMSHYLSKCRESGISTLYLVTDTQCDYQYYDNANFVMLNEESFELRFLSGSAHHRTFLYSLKL